MRDITGLVAWVTGGGTGIGEGAAAALAKAAGKPVKFYFSKEEHFGAFVLRLSSRFRGKIGIKKDGTVTAVSGQWFIDTGAFLTEAYGGHLSLLTLDSLFDDSGPTGAGTDDLFRKW